MEIVGSKRKGRSSGNNQTVKNVLNGNNNVANSSSYFLTKSSSVVLSELDKAPQLHLEENQLTCIGSQSGYRMVRATHGVHRGAYFWEMEILSPLCDNSHVRAGWSSRLGELQAPVGFDKYSFAYRDINGSKIHRCVRNDNYGEPYGVGDIIGCFINLQDNVEENYISFYKNGVNQGIAFRGEDIPSGVYYPAISLYLKSVVRVNFGPTYILKYNHINGISPVSEVQPMNPQERKIHDVRIATIRQNRKSESLNTDND